MCQAGFELGEPVAALGGGVRDPGQDRGDDLVFPSGYSPGQGEQLGRVIVAGAPVVEGEESAADVSLAGGGAVMRARRFSTSRSFSIAI
jgi:hypothetical protein